MASLLSEQGRNFLLFGLQTVEYQFVKASELAEQLKNKLGDFSKQRDDLNRRLEEQQKWLQEVREKLKQADDTSGSDEDLVNRLQTVQVRLLLCVCDWYEIDDVSCVGRPKRPNVQHVFGVLQPAGGGATIRQKGGCQVSLGNGR